MRDLKRLLTDFQKKNDSKSTLSNKTVFPLAMRKNQKEMR